MDASMPAFSEVELTAIARIAISMAEADGHVDDREMQSIGKALGSFYNGPAEAGIAICATAVSINETDAIMVARQMTMKKKAALAVWLISVILADGVIKDAEVAKFRSIGRECGFPTVEVEEALNQMQAKKKQAEKQQTQSTNNTVSPNSSGCLVPIIALLSLATLAFLGCGPKEPSLAEVERGMVDTFRHETGNYTDFLDAKAKRIGNGRWAVRMTGERYGERRTLNATAVMDKDGDIHYYTE